MFRNVVYHLEIQAWADRIIRELKISRPLNQQIIHLSIHLYLSYTPRNFPITPSGSNVMCKHQQMQRNSMGRATDKLLYPPCFVLGDHPFPLCRLRRSHHTCSTFYKPTSSYRQQEGAFGILKLGQRTVR